MLDLDCEGQLDLIAQPWGQGDREVGTGQACGSGRIDIKDAASQRVESEPGIVPGIDQSAAKVLVI